MESLEDSRGEGAVASPGARAERFAVAEAAREQVFGVGGNYFGWAGEYWEVLADYRTVRKRRGTQMKGVRQEVAYLAS